MTDEEDSGFTVVDKRRAGQEAAAASSESPAESSTEPQPAAPPAQSPNSPSTEAQANAGSPLNDGESDLSPNQLPRLSVRDRLFMCIDVLQQGAWIAMGLVADPATGQIEKDLAGAKIAIDSVAFLVEKVEGELDEEIRRELRRIVSDLRINFVQQSNR